ncbi:hypothetical protein LCGC14_2155090, partial [marine sediment metagenome]
MSATHFAGPVYSGGTLLTGSGVNYGQPV